MPSPGATASLPSERREVPRRSGAAAREAKTRKRASVSSPGAVGAKAGLARDSKASALPRRHTRFLMPAVLGNTPLQRWAPLGPCQDTERAPGLSTENGLQNLPQASSHPKHGAAQPQGSTWPLHHGAGGSSWLPGRPAGTSLEFQGRAVFTLQGEPEEAGLPGDRVCHQEIGSLQMLGGPTDSCGQHSASPRASARRGISDRLCRMLVRHIFSLRPAGLRL